MKTFRLFSMAAVALLMAACSNSDDFDVQKPAETAGVFHFEATIAAPNADASTRTVYTEDGTTINVKWEVGDKIALVHNGVVDEAEVKTVDDVTGKATIEADITGNPSDNDDVTLAYPANAVVSATPYDTFPFTPNPDIFDNVKNDQDGTLTYIQNNLDLRMGSGKLAVSGSDVSLKGSVSVPSLICIWKLTLQDNASTPLSATKLTFKNNDDTQAGATSTAKSVYYLCVVPSFIPDASGTFSFEATVGSDTYTYSKSGVSLAAGKYYQSTVKMADMGNAPAGCELVDLGLPSGTKWANMNLGATSVTDYGDFFAWGETEPYYSSQSPSVTWKTGKTAGYDWASYQWTTDGGSSFTKYTGSDNKTTLEAADDAATANWGGDWRMPTKAELEELFKTSPDYTESDKIDGYSWEWQYNYQGSGHAGYLITVTKECAQKGNSIFLPAAGYRDGTSLKVQGSYGWYWSSTLDEGYPDWALDLSICSSYAAEKTSYRHSGSSVRPVQGAPTPVVPDGAISGQFSVSATKKVYFSKGNLRYASGTWSFFDNQYDYFTTHDGTNWEHFGWSTSATTYGMNTSTSNSTYSGDFVDWGSNSDLQTALGTGWFTLSSAEWTYLFNTRSASTVGGTENGRYAKAKVNDVQGIILFPDTYTHPDGVTAPTGVNVTGNAGWNGNSYTVADWTKMEAAGAVFLPAAGSRDGSPVGYLGKYGNYWSATPNYELGAYSVCFGPSYLEHAKRNRFFGFSVRLVREVPAGSPGTEANDRSYGSQNDLGTW